MSLCTWIEAYRELATKTTSQASNHLACIAVFAWRTVMFTVNSRVKEWLGLEINREDELVKSLFGTAIMFASCALFFLNIWCVSLCCKKRTVEALPPR